MERNRYEWRIPYFCSMNEVVLSLGSNLGDRVHWIRSAYDALEKLGVQPQFDSSVYETEPWGFEAENTFYNTILAASYAGTPEELLVIIHRIEHELGRKRIAGTRYSSRTIDIDIVFFNNLVFHNEFLQIPHPQLQSRNFVLAPLNEVIPKYIHPVLLVSVSELFQQSDDNNPAFIVHSPMLSNQ